MREKIAEKFYKVLAILTAIMVLYAIIAVLAPIATRRHVESRPCYGFDEGWVTDTGLHVKLSQVEMTDLNDECVYSYKKTLPARLSDNEELMFQTQHVFFKVYVDDTLIYSYHPKLARMVGKSYGTKMHFINLGIHSQAKTVKIVAQPIYDDLSANFNYVFIGNSGAYISRGIRENIGSIVLSLATIFLSLLVLLLASGLPKDNRQRMSMIYLAILGISGSIWVFLESRIFSLIFIGGVRAENIDIFMILISAYASVGFVNDFYEVKTKFWIRACIVVNFLTVLTMLVSIATNFMDYHELLHYVQGIAMAEALLDVFLIVRYAVISKNRNLKKVSPAISCGFLVIILGVFYSIFKYVWVGNTAPNSSKIMGTALLILMTIMLAHYNKEINANTKKAVKASVFEKMAYTDELTGIENRAAYYRNEMSYKEQIENGELAGLMIVNMDLNNLKMVNDIYGHDYGDKYLTSASEVIRRSFSKIGSVYRIGGDEFIALVPLKYEHTETLEKDENLIVEMIRSNQSLIGRRDGWEEELSIAFGIAYYFGDEEIEEAEKRADRAMYRMKNQMKAEK